MQASQHFGISTRLSCLTPWLISLNSSSIIASHMFVELLNSPLEVTAGLSFLVVVEIISHVAQAVLKLNHVLEDDLELPILLSLPSECLDYRHVPP